MYMPTKKYLIKKAEQIMFNGSNCDRKSQLSGILTEPLNPRSRDSLRSKELITCLKIL